jgi:hypothetical protein
MKSPAVGIATRNLIWILPLVAGALTSSSSCSRGGRAPTPQSRGNSELSSEPTEAIARPVAVRTEAARSPRVRIEELVTPVPATFAEAQTWNETKVCPAGSELSPFTRYAFEPGENSRGFKHYYGRGCAIVQIQEIEGLEDETVVPSRKLASIDPAAQSQAAPRSRTRPSATMLLPHGPYIWWYENGAKMEGGTFELGTLAEGAMQYEPDGSLAEED